MFFWNFVFALQSAGSFSSALFEKISKIVDSRLWGNSSVSVNSPFFGILANYVEPQIICYIGIMVFLRYFTYLVLRKVVYNVGYLKGFRLCSNNFFKEMVASQFTFDFDIFQIHSRKELFVKNCFRNLHSGATIWLLVKNDFSSIIIFS